MVVLALHRWDMTSERLRCAVSTVLCLRSFVIYIFFLLALKARVYMWAAAWMVCVPWLDDLFHVFLLPFALFPFLNYSAFSSESVEPAPHFHSSIPLKPRTRRLPYLSTETQLKSTEIKKMPGVWRGWCFSQRCRFVLLMAALFGNHYKTRCNQWSCISILVVTAATPPLQHKHTELVLSSKCLSHPLALFTIAGWLLGLVRSKLDFCCVCLLKIMST